MTGQVHSVTPDTLEQALETMQTRKVRRLPVVNSEGELEGILSMNDVVRIATPAKTGPVSYGAIVKTYQAI